MKLAKLSSPGWEIEVDTEEQAKAILYSCICKQCLKELAFELEHGDHFLYQERNEVIIDWGYVTPARVEDITMSDLLQTPCGCEYDWELIPWVKVYDSKD